MKILITGGAGFIGSHLSDKLLSFNHKIFIVDNFSSGKYSNLQSQCEVFDVDIRNKFALASVFEEVKPDYVYHLAAQINVRKSIKDPSEDADINIGGTLNVLEQCAKHKVKKIVFTSSGGAIYEDNHEKIKTESSVIKPASPYGIAKFTAEQYINFYKQIYGLDYTILRLSNVSGPRQAGGECGVLSIFINKLLQNKSITVFGNGEQTRDYVSVFDVVNALVVALEHSGTYNVSTGTATSVNRLISILSNYLPCNDVIYADAVPGELFHNCLSNNLLKSTGWKQQMSLEETVKLTVNYFKFNI